MTPLLIAALAVPVVVGVLAYVWLALALAAVLRKAGVEAWRAWVPVYNVWTLLELGAVRGWWALVAAGIGALAALLAVPFQALAASSGGARGAVVVLLGVGLQATLVLAALAVYVVVLARALSRVNPSFGLGAGYTVLGVLLLPVWASVVGWGSARWLGAAGADPADAEPRYARGLGAHFGAGFEAEFDAAWNEGRHAPTTDASAPTPPAPTTPPPPRIAAADAAVLYGAHEPRGGDDTPAHDPWAPPAPKGDARDARPAAPAPEDGPSAAAPSAWAPAPLPTATTDPVVALGAAGDDGADRTVLVARRAEWVLVLPDGRTHALAHGEVVLGRNPTAPPHAPEAIAIAVDDVTRTVSKTHALLRRTAIGWNIEDLGSTNGVVLQHDAGESELPPATEAAVTARFFLGDAVLEIRRGDTDAGGSS